MAENLDIIKASATAEVDGVEVKAAHNEKTYELIKTARQELADWHVQWGKKPVADTQGLETAQRLREENDQLIEQFRPLPMRDAKNRLRNLMHVSEFCRKLHNILGFAADGGSRIFINMPPAIAGFDNEKMKGLFVKMRGMDMFTFHMDLPAGWKKICAIQTPYMSEWSQMNYDDRGNFKSWKHIGWRGNVLLRLILANAITKEEAHKEFGVPQGTEVDKEYFTKLREYEINAKRESN